MYKKLDKEQFELDEKQKKKDMVKYSILGSLVLFIIILVAIIIRHNV